MTRIRRDVAKMQHPWDDAVLWYARGVKVLKSRTSLADPTSWRYLAAMHGIDSKLWTTFGYLGDNESVPDTTEFKQDRDQCQHHTWYFLPWHRGYLSAFERIMQAAIASISGPNDWALPYWNYNGDPDSKALPAAFVSNDWPDNGDNPLYTPRRYGPYGDGQVRLTDDTTDLRAPWNETRFKGVTTGGSTGFGGAPTPFAHNADRRAEGILEQQPHDTIHGAIGGSQDNKRPPQYWGLMSNPNTAALDPIFWLHHANLDRLWDIWLKRGNANPPDQAWNDGPQGAQIFIMPAPDKSRHRFSPAEMLDTTAPALDYRYEDMTDPLPGHDRLNLRKQNLQLSHISLNEVAVASTPEVELLGASKSAVTLSGAETHADVHLDRLTNKKVINNFTFARAADREAVEPDRIFLNLENITGGGDPTLFKVYVGLAWGEDPESHPEAFAGVVSLFGISSANDPKRSHGGGFNKVLEITEVIDKLHLAGLGDLSEVPVRFVAINTFGDDLKVGRVSFYRQGQ